MQLCCLWAIHILDKPEAGKKNENPIPSCVVKKNRESFPSDSDSYKGPENAH